VTTKAIAAGYEVTASMIELTHGSMQRTDHPVNK
jgi:hypothetical protein